jgi:hypothetical protein
MKRINIKISSYTSNDIRAGRLSYNPLAKSSFSQANFDSGLDISKPNHKIITPQEFLELYTLSAKCYYCFRECDMIPKSKYNSAGLTLERLDNTLPHTYLNCVIACLGCNILRSNDLSSKDMSNIFKRRLVA